VFVRTVMGESEGVGRGNVRERIGRGGRGASDRNGNGGIGERARGWKQGNGRIDGYKGRGTCNDELSGK